MDQTLLCFYEISFQQCKWSHAKLSFSTKFLWIFSEILIQKAIKHIQELKYTNYLMQNYLFIKICMNFCWTFILKYHRKMYRCTNCISKYTILVNGENLSFQQISVFNLLTFLKTIIIESLKTFFLLYLLFYFVFMLEKSAPWHGKK